MIDTVRASREGHHFHEAWTSRLALELFAPKDELAGIAVEGFPPGDAGNVNQAAIEIADLVLYYGDDRCTFETCTRQHVLQFKYSISEAQATVAASDLNKTLRKFAEAEKALLKRHRETGAMQKRRYGFVTNRPISPWFLAAVEHIRKGTRPELKEKAVWNQYKGFCAAVLLDPAERAAFALRLDFQGEQDKVAKLNDQVAQRLASWSASDDAMANARLNGLRSMVRSKAESDGEPHNLIRRFDVLTALGLSGEEQLLPVPPAFPVVATSVVRTQTFEILDQIPGLAGPLIVHAPGGSGKTVLMQSVQANAPAHFEVVLFDCFGGGAYRALEDARHRLGNGLVHIANELAVKGLCDPLLPFVSDASALLRSFRKRLAQAVETLHTRRADSLLVLLVDAADNAAQAARDRGEDAFPVALVESAVRIELPTHVRLVLSCRTERQALLGTGPELHRFALPGFTRAEAEEYVLNSIADASGQEIDIAMARSAGNPRVLSHLVREWDDLIRKRESLAPLDVDDLIAQRVQTATGEAAVRDRGLDYLEPFLAGLAVLPPPIPLADYADANGIELTQAKSMFADLSPLLDMTPLGITFRDEPTETFFRNRYGNNLGALHALARRLDDAQDESQYACYALPGLLLRLGDMHAAVALAYSERLPHARMSDVGRRALRVLRIRAALGLAARRGDAAAVTGLLAELGGLQHGETQGDRFIASNPDLVALTDDIDAMRRLFKMPARRPETRHARLAIVNLLKGDGGEAARHAKRIVDWSDWRNQQGVADVDPAEFRIEMTALALNYVARGALESAFRLIAALPLETGFAIASRVLALARQLPGADRVDGVCAALCACSVAAPSLFAAALVTWQDCDTVSKAALLEQLVRSVEKADQALVLRPVDALHRALLDAAAAALRLGMAAQCACLLRACRMPRPDMREFEGASHGTELAPWLFHTIIDAAQQGRMPSLRDLLPAQIHVLAASHEATPERILSLLAGRMDPSQEAREDAEDMGEDTDEERPETMSGIFAETIVPLLDLAQACARVLATGGDAGGARALVAAWECLPLRDTQGERLHTSARHLHPIGRELSLRTLGACHPCPPGLAERCVEIATEGGSWTVYEQIAQVSVFAATPATHEAACMLAESVAPQIAAKTRMHWRSEAYGELARAILPVSPDDAHALCRRGLSMVDEVSIGDQALVSEVLALTANMKEIRLDPLRAYRFIHLCVACFGGAYASHFPWDRLGQAAAAALGGGALALLGQWEHEGLLDLDNALAPTVTGLLQRGLLDAAPALALLLLDLPKQWHSLNDTTSPAPRRELDGGIVSALIGRGDLNVSAVFDALLRQARAAQAWGKFPLLLLHALLARGHRVQDVPEAVLKDIQARLAAHASQGQAEFDAGNERQDPGSAAIHARLAAEADTALCAVDEIASTTDVADSGAIELAWSRFDALGARLPEQAIFDALQARVKPAQRQRFLEALARARVPYDAADARLAALAGCLAQWGKAPSVQDIRPLLASHLVGADPASLVENPYSLETALQRLAALGPTSVASVARGVVENVCIHDLDAHPRVWLTLAAALAPEVNAADASTISHRLFDSAMARLAARGKPLEHSGWPGTGVAAADGVAGLIWYRLGDVLATRRARATSAIVLLAEYGRWDELDRLAARYDARDAGQFGNPAIRFCHLHARWSLASGLALAARAYPMQMQRYRVTLSQLLDANPSHVLLRNAVESGLDALGGNRSTAPPARSVGDLEKWVNAEGVPEFRFDDQQRRFSELARVFGIATRQVAALVARQIVEWDPTVTQVMEDEELLDRSDDYAEYISVSAELHYGAHLCWHAVFAVGDQLASACDSHGRRYDAESWKAMIARQALGTPS
jgi:hypothetical protein